MENRMHTHIEREEEKCGCVPNHYTCGKCRRKELAKAYRNLTPEQKAYDRYVDPLGAYHIDFPAGCSCHISPPCSYCVNDDDVQLVKINVACCNQCLNNMNSYTDNRGIFYWCKNCEHSFYLDEI